MELIKIIGNFSSACVEAHAILRAMTSSLDKCFAKVIFESDAIGIITKLQNKSLVLSDDDQIVGDCLQLLNSFVATRFFHVRREGNGLAVWHMVAKLAFVTGFKFPGFWMNEVPQCIIPLLDIIRDD